ncbi:hypothetical protein COSO111634_06570 [Corallococcus soli]
MRNRSGVTREENAYSTSVSPVTGARSFFVHVLPISSSTWRGSSASPPRCFSTLRAVSSMSATRSVNTGASNVPVRATAASSRPASSTARADSRRRPLARSASPSARTCSGRSAPSDATPDRPSSRTSVDTWATPAFISSPVSALPFFTLFFAPVPPGATGADSAVTKASGARAHATSRAAACLQNGRERAAMHEQRPFTSERASPNTSETLYGVAPEPAASANRRFS